MIQKFKTHIQKHFPQLETAKLLITVSGGVDSMVLCELLKELNFNFSIAHCNFNLRGAESDSDEAFVKGWASSQQIHCFTKSFKTNDFAEMQKISIQMAARELRYTWFQELATEHEFDFIATAHHQDDALETFIINLTRGTGIDGLTGIQKQHNNIIRPLLPFSKETILSYANSQNLEWREDQSNSDTKYLRNKIRHEITPLLKELNPSFLESFQTTTEHLEQSKSFIKDQIKSIKADVFETSNGVTKISIEKLIQLNNKAFILFELLKEYGFTEWSDVQNLVSAQSGKIVTSKTHRLIKDRDFLLLSTQPSCTKESFEIDRNTTNIKLPNLNMEISKAFRSLGVNIDATKLKFPLIIRKKQEGDFFYPTGMQGKKKISKYFKDQKLSLIDKENTWLLVNGDGSIIWIINHRLDRRFEATNKEQVLNFETS